MIIDTINNIKAYESIIPYSQDIMRFIDKVVAGEIKFDTDRVEICGDSVFALINRYQTKESNIWEAHKKYIDIHWMLSGNESILYANLRDLYVVKEYDDKNDFMILEGSGDRFTLSANRFAVLFPEDAHQPGLIADDVEQVMKIVLKVKIVNS
ncbi:MAG: YhcH/YjgK/YiaL family protein [Bacteroidales bacterium]|nr:YhcH/YjgK/YiaL family protein [Bacteroidales bacterium]